MSTKKNTGVGRDNTSENMATQSAITQKKSRNKPDGLTFWTKLMDDPRRDNEYMYRDVYLALREKSSDFKKASVEEQKGQLGMMLCAYFLAKAMHRGQTRIGGERYFEHIKGVTQILIEEFPTLTIEQVLAAYLHDVVEDSDITIATIENIFGEKVAAIVDAVTKKPDEYYLRPDERSLYVQLDRKEKKEYLTMKKAAIKSRRTEHYFGHMADLSPEILQVKFADRIHNLRDLAHCKTSKIKDQIAETQQYMLPLAAKKNQTAYTLMKIELEKLHTHVYGDTKKFVTYLEEILQ